MPRTINEGFQDFLKNLTPSPADTTKAKSHRASIDACLKANFNLTRLFRSGSFGNGTSIFGYSDVDYFASIPQDKLKQNSSDALTQIRNPLAERFPKTGVRVSCPAIRLPFGSGKSETHEIVPAKLVGATSAKKSVYEIPNCSGGWMKSSPEAHTSYVRDVDVKLAGKVRPLIRFVKAWKYYQDVPLSSFYLELRVAKYAESRSSIVFDLDLLFLFRRLHKLELARMQDPMGVSGYVVPCVTQTQFETSMSKLTTALSRIEKACNAKEAGNIRDAFSSWNMVYDGKFPGYYK